MSIRLSLPFLAVLAGILLASGCKKTYFDLELRPEGDTLHRTFNTELNEEDLPRLTEIYGHGPATEEVETADGKTQIKYTYEGGFQKVTPDDIGGSGFLLHCDSGMGSSSLYSEQFRGRDDLADILRRQEDAFNRFFDLVALWFETEFGEAPDYAALSKIIDEELRQDIWNLSLYISTFGIVGVAGGRGQEGMNDRLFEQIANRAVHFLIARGYFEASSLQTLSALLTQPGNEEKRVFEIFARALMNKMGLPKEDPLLPSLATIRDDLDKYGDSLDEFAELGELAVDAFPSDFTLGNDGGEFLRVDLHLPQAPYSSNGDWNESGVLQWRERLAKSDERKVSLPNSLYAMWSNPNVDFQEKHFGRVVLDDEDLLEYCEWRPGLSKKQGRQWDKFVRSLRPGEALIQSLNDFKFKGEADRTAILKPSEVKWSIASSVVSVIVHALEEAPEEEEVTSPIY